MIDRDFIREHDWSRTPLGPFDAWSPVLRGYVALIAEMPSPAIIFWGPAQTQIYNEGYAAIMGPRHPRYFGAPYRECWPDTYPVIAPWMDEVLSRGAIKQVERALFTVTRHGFTEEAYFTFTFSPLRDETGAIAGIFQPVVEVTDAVLADRRGEALRAIAPPHGAVGDPLGETIAALRGVPADVPFARIYLPDEATRALTLVGATDVDPAAADRVAPAEVEAVQRAGVAVELDDAGRVLGAPHHGPWPEPTRTAFAAPLRRADGDPVLGVIVLGISPRLRFDDRYRAFFEAVARDLATRLVAVAATRAERELLAREAAARREAELHKEHLVALFTQAPTPIVVLRGPELVVELANAHALRLWQRARDEAIDRPLFDVLPELRGQVFQRLLEQVYRTGAPYVGEEVKATLAREGGASDEVYLTFVYAPLRGVGGAVEGVLVFAFDVTAQVRARAEVDGLRAAAEAASRAKDEFLAVLGHELRNPLAPIVTSIELLRRRDDVSPGRELEVIERQAAHLVRLVDDLLDVSRITRGKLELRRERLDVAASIHDALEMVRPLIQQRGHALEVDVGAGLWIDGDRGRMTQVFANLLSNAAKYTEPGGRVALAAREVGHGLEISVTDSGIGIERELLPRVFDMFVQERQASDRSQGGLGLGLTIVRTLVELHGGTVAVQSAGRGRGASFVVRLPRAARTDEAIGTRPARRRPEALAPGPRRRILLVDDNHDAAELLGVWLETLGHTVAIAHDGPAALRAVDDFVPDVGLLDIGLPAMDGHELARRLRARAGFDRVRLVALTGYGQDADRQRSRDAGFDAHLVKPVDIHRLQAIIQELTAGETTAPPLDGD